VAEAPAVAPAHGVSQDAPADQSEKPASRPGSQC